MHCAQWRSVPGHVRARINAYTPCTFARAQFKRVEQRVYPNKVFIVDACVCGDEIMVLDLHDRMQIWSALDGTWLRTWSAPVSHSTLASAHTVRGWEIVVLQNDTLQVWDVMGHLKRSVPVRNWRWVKVAAGPNVVLLSMQHAYTQTRVVTLHLDTLASLATWVMPATWSCTSIGCVNDFIVLVLVGSVRVCTAEGTVLYQWHLRFIPRALSVVDNAIVIMAECSSQFHVYRCDGTPLATRYMKDMCKGMGTTRGTLVCISYDRHQLVECM